MPGPGWPKANYAASDTVNNVIINAIADAPHNWPGDVNGGGNQLLGVSNINTSGTITGTTTVAVQNSTFPVFLLNATGGTSNQKRLALVLDGTGASFAFQQQNDTGGFIANQVTIGTTNGNLTILGTATKPGGGSWAAPSDRRTKQNIENFPDGLGVVERIQPVSYEYNGLGGTKADGKRHIGVIAQDAAAAVPYCISEYSAPLNPGDESATALMQFDPSALCFVLINAVKELAARVATLENKEA